MSRMIETLHRVHRGHRTHAAALARPARSRPLVSAGRAASGRLTHDNLSVRQAGAPARSPIQARPHGVRPRSSNRVDRTAAAYAGLFQQIDLELDLSEPRCLCFTSASAGEGKTTTALNLASAAGRQMDRRVLVVDANLARPQIAARLGIQPKLGLTDVLADGVLPSEAICEVPLDGFDVLSAGRPNPRAAELLSGRRMDVLLWELRQSYNLIIIDAPHVSDPSIATMFATDVDGVFLVVQMHKTRRQAVDAALGHLHAAGVTVRGCVLTHQGLLANVSLDATEDEAGEKLVSVRAAAGRQFAENSPLCSASFAGGCPDTSPNSSSFSNRRPPATSFVPGFDDPAAHAGPFSWPPATGEDKLIVEASEMDSVSASAALMSCVSLFDIAEPSAVGRQPWAEAVPADGPLLRESIDCDPQLDVTQALNETPVAQLPIPAVNFPVRSTASESEGASLDAMCVFEWPDTITQSCDRPEAPSGEMLMLDEDWAGVAFWCEGNSRSGIRTEALLGPFMETEPEELASEFSDSSITDTWTCVASEPRPEMAEPEFCIDSNLDINDNDSVLQCQPVVEGDSCPEAPDEIGTATWSLDLPVSADIVAEQPAEWEPRHKADIVAEFSVPQESTENYTVLHAFEPEEDFEQPAEWETLQKLETIRPFDPLDLGEEMPDYELAAPGTLAPNFVSVFESSFEDSLDQFTAIPTLIGAADEQPTVDCEPEPLATPVRVQEPDPLSLESDDANFGPVQPSVGISDIAEDPWAVNVLAVCGVLLMLAGLLYVAGDVFGF